MGERVLCWWFELQSGELKFVETVILIQLGRNGTDFVGFGEGGETCGGWWEDWEGTEGESPKENRIWYKEN